MKYKEMDWKAWLAVIIAIIIVSGRLANLPADTIRERMREAYV